MHKTISLFLFSRSHDASKSPPHTTVFLSQVFFFSYLGWITSGGGGASLLPLPLFSAFSTAFASAMAQEQGASERERRGGRV